MNCLIRTGPLLVAGKPDRTKFKGKMKTFHIRKFRTLRKEHRYWKSKGWRHGWPITGVPFSRWHKVIHGQEFIAFVQTENNASNVYGFYRGPLFIHPHAS